MARISFADLVRNAGVNYQAEYKTLLMLLNGSANKIFPDREFKGDYMFGYEGERRSFADFCDEHFESFPIELRGTCRSLSGFNQYIKFYPERVENPDLDALLTLTEYFMTFSSALQKRINSAGLYTEKTVNSHIIQHLNILLGKLHHKVVPEGPLVRLVPEDVVVAEVASNLPKELAIKAFLYRHRSMAGNIEKKRESLLSLGHQLESKRGLIHDKTLEAAIFSILNNMNIRHNNVDAENTAKYHEFVAKLESRELEKWYDRLYQMMVAAFARLDTAEDVAVYEANKRLIGA